MSGLHMRSESIVQRPDDDVGFAHDVDVPFVAFPTSNVRVNIALLDDYFLNLTRINGIRIIQHLHPYDSTRGRHGVGDHPLARIWDDHLNFLFGIVQRADAEWIHRMEDPARPMSRVGSTAVTDLVRIWSRELEGWGTKSLPPRWWGEDDMHRSNRAVLMHAHPDYYNEVFRRLKIDPPIALAKGFYA
jgi:hypothetical protein